MVTKLGKVFDSFADFKKFFLDRFGKNEALTKQIADNALQLLHQQYSVHPYATEFRCLVVYTRHELYSQLLMFKHGLKKPVKLYLLALPNLPKTLSKLIRITVSYDKQVQVFERQETRLQAPVLSCGHSQDSNQ
jgi:hypothetical protein